MGRRTPKHPSDEGHDQALSVEQPVDDSGLTVDPSDVRTWPLSAFDVRLVWLLSRMGQEWEPGIVARAAEELARTWPVGEDLGGDISSAAKLAALRVVMCERDER